MIDMKLWFGVVEDRKDPLKLGRVRVRIIGLHSEKKQISEIEGVPTSDLPWAYPSQPITSAAMNGVGETPIGPVEGTHVWGFSRDEYFNDLVVCGCIGGIPHEEADPSKGFNDPNGKYPKKDYLNEPDTNRLARNEKIEETIVKKKKDSIDKDVPMANGGQWSEPETPYAAEYPYNHVEESESGHIHEIDDTKDHERIHEYHKSGTFEEIHPDGKKVCKVVSDRYHIILGSDYVHIVGDCSITVDGGAKIYVEGDANIQVNGDVISKIKGDYNMDIGGQCKVKSGGRMRFMAPRIDLN